MCNGSPRGSDTPPRCCVARKDDWRVCALWVGEHHASNLDSQCVESPTPKRGIIVNATIDVELLEVASEAGVLKEIEVLGIAQMRNRKVCELWKASRLCPCRSRITKQREIGG